MVSYLLLVEPGAMAERLKALVLKTSDTERYRGFESLSLRSPALEKYPSGRRGSPAKGVVRVTAARVQIPASPHQNPGNFDVPGVFILPLYRHYTGISFPTLLFCSQDLLAAKLEQYNECENLELRYNNSSCKKARLR